MDVLQTISGLGIQPRFIDEAIGAADNIRQIYGAVVFMQWAPSHCGVKGNEMADSLALEAALAVPTYEAPCTFQQATAKIREWVNEKWIKAWDVSDKARRVWQHMRWPDRDYLGGSSRGRSYQ